MRDLTLSLTGSVLKRKNRVSVSSKILNLSLFSGIVFFALLYLFQINGMSTQGYEIRNLEQQVRLLESEQKSLQLQASDLQSINRVQSEAQTLNFVPVTTVTYLKDSDFALK